MADETKTDDQPTQALVEKPKKDMAKLEAQSGVLPILPTNLEEAQRYASGLILAGIVPEAFKFSEKEARDREGVSKGDINGPLVLMGVLKSMEIGVAPQTGLAGLLPLNGRFSVWGDLAAGLVQRGGQVANQSVTWVGGTFDPNTPLGDWPDDYGCEVRYWRKGQESPYIGRFTVRDAKRAHLWMNQYKKPWIEHPNRMLFNRARALVLRDGFADALMGLSIAEEVIDMMPAPEEVGRVEAKRLTALIDDSPDTGPATNNGHVLPPDGEPKDMDDAGQPVEEPQEEQGDTPAATSGPPEPENAPDEAPGRPAAENEGEPKPTIQGPNGEILDEDSGDGKLI